MRASTAFARRLEGLGLRLGHWVLLALGSTWRIRHGGRARVAAARMRRGPVLYCFTHGVLLPLAYTHRGRGIRVLISESRDGEVITRVVERLGFRTVRGSTSRGGLRALAELVARAREGSDLAVTPDGPRGPRGSAEPGAVLVGAKAGIPLVPVGVASPGAWRANSWDRFLVPRPFARVFVVYGAAIELAPADAARAEEVSRNLENAMAAAEAEAEAWARGALALPDATGDAA